MRILITGGAGFVGSALACRFRRDGAEEVHVLDNLRRRGSELNLPILKSEGVVFHHGDIRVRTDIEDVSGAFDLVVDAAAEPSVLAGINAHADYLIQTNLLGTVNALEFARARGSSFLFISTSRVYSVAPLRELSLEETPTRVELTADQVLSGASARGIAEEFPTHLARSLYGATKLASEMLVQEYVQAYGLKAVINRCGVIAGPGQFGKVDQGVFTLWVANHYFGKSLTYTGFGGTGKQVRDLLHPDDLFRLIRMQLDKPEAWTGAITNVGGGRQCSTSLLELTSLCREITGREVPIGKVAETKPVDIPLYVTDGAMAERSFGWVPQLGVKDIVEDIHAWIQDNDGSLKGIFG
ncbi:MAG: NAD-dependent epimerase/dehydratase family protein [Chloroflexi bacterium]|nr:NAD-dependent epimerase/dehydratase family protein [Chloroflexota bacterium]